MSTPVLNIRLTGEENVSVFSESITWTPQSKLELTLAISSASGSKTIDYSTIETVKTMLFYGSGAYTVTVTVGSDSIAFESNDFFVFSPSEVFRATITSIAISTTSTSTIEVQCRVYGEE